MPVILSGNDVSTFSNGARSAPVAENQQFPGYQQGTFLATVESEFGGSKWIENGVIVGTNAYPQSSFTWWRIGQVVTVNVFFRATTAGNADNEIFMIKGYPYLSKESDPSNYYQNFAGVWAPNFISPASAYPTIFAGTINLPKQHASNKEYYTGESSLLYFSDIDTPSSTVLDKHIQANGQIAFTISYLTDDTTWQPINGALIS